MSAGWESTYTYSGEHLRIDKALFMKEKCQIQMDTAQNENAATPLRSKDINTIQQHFHMRYINFIWLKVLKSYQSSNLKFVDFEVK